MKNSSSQLHSILHGINHCLEIVNLEPKFPTSECLKQFKESADNEEAENHLIKLKEQLEKQSCYQKSLSGILSSILKLSLNDIKLNPNENEQPSFLKQDWIEFTKFNSAFSNLFMSVIMKGYWCDSCQQSIRIQKKVENFFEISDPNKDLQNQLIEISNGMLDQQLDENKSCEQKNHSKMLQINGLIKLPNFLFIILNDKADGIEQKSSLNLYDEIKKNLESYSLKGQIFKKDENYSYWKLENHDWIEMGSKADMQKQNNLNKEYNLRGLLFVKDQLNKVVYSNTDLQASFMKKEQTLFEKLKDEGYSSLQENQRTQEFVQILGENEEHQKVVISLFKVSMDKIEGYKNLNKSLLRNKLDHVAYHKKTFVLEAQEFFGIENIILEEYSNLQQHIKDNKCTEEQKIQIFHQIEELIEQMDKHEFLVEPLSLQDVLINSENNAIIQSYLLFAKVHHQKESNSIMYLKKQLKLNTIQAQRNAAPITHQIFQQDALPFKGKVSFRNQEQTEIDQLNFETFLKLKEHHDTNIDFKDIQKIIPILNQYGYIAHKFLGIGSFGVVLQAKKKSTGEELAIKMIPFQTPHRLASHMIEYSLMRKLNSKFVCNIKESFIDVISKRYFFIVGQYYEGGDLQKYIHNNPNLKEEEIIRIFKGILEGVQHLHDKEIVHSDLKPENILLTKDNQPIIADFGLANIMKNKLNAQKKGMNLLYSPYELLFQSNDKIYKDTDYFSLGLILFTLCGQTNTQEIWSIKQGNQINLENRPFQSLLKQAMKMMHSDQSQRQNIKDTIIQLDEIQFNSKRQK